MDVTSISQLLNILQNYQTIRFIQVVPATFMVYDCALYLDDEINYVWKKRLTSISVAYLIFRYLGIVYIMFSLGEFVSNTTSISKAIANAFPILAMCMNCLSVWFVQVILGLRLYALYNGSRRVLLVIGIGFIAEFITMIVAYPSAARKAYVNYGAIVVYETILFSLALSAAVRRYREKPGPSPANRSGAKRLTDILIEGNVVYFLACVQILTLYPTKSDEITCTVGTRSMPFSTLWYHSLFLLSCCDLSSKKKLHL
ncbi:hypothetical protein PISMIDRAFT_183767 [Pisolithus microcarpus 441]|uniref:DUF6533 domain-containing protein n=1 Tax=Pisolithus microcarpus 441 TaxID=765257 RepID=A0A0C9ZYV7_9AGAM|nr:hypothetical protein PISMIDRAFT_183767 [Pisolithus microcarpus 441]